MPDEYRALATHLMMVHTEGELTGADDYTQVFYNLAPNAYEKFVCCERAAEEVQHYELSAEVLAGLDVDTSGMLAQHFQQRPYYANELVRGVKAEQSRGDGVEVRVDITGPLPRLLDSLSGSPLQVDNAKPPVDGIDALLSLRPQ